MTTNAEALTALRSLAVEAIEALRMEDERGLRWVSAATALLNAGEKLVHSRSGGARLAQHDEIVRGLVAIAEQGAILNCARILDELRDRGVPTERLPRNPTAMSHLLVSLRPVLAEQGVHVSAPDRRRNRRLFLEPPEREVEES